MLREHTHREETVRRNAIRKEEYDPIPLWPNQCDWRSNLCDYKHTQNIHRHTFSKELAVGSKAKWNNSTCRLPRESTTPFHSHGKREREKAPLSTEMLSQGWRTQYLSLPLHCPSKPIPKTSIKADYGCNNWFIKKKKAFVGYTI